MLKPSIIIVPLIMVAGCATETRLDNSSTAVRVSTALPPPDTPVAFVDVAPYRMGPGDEITVTVFGAPELQRAAVIDAAGMFAVPLVGSIAAAGKTPQEFATEIENNLRGPYLKQPRVSVNITKAINQQMVTVDGEVEQPGVYPIAGRLTLQQAVATAQGATELANVRNVIVFRTVGGQKMAAMFDLKGIRSGRVADPQIYGNDVVVVGESAVQKFLKSAPWAAVAALGRFVPAP